MSQKSDTSIKFKPFIYIHFFKMFFFKDINVKELKKFIDHRLIIKYLQIRNMILL